MGRDDNERGKRRRSKGCWRDSREVKKTDRAKEETKRLSSSVQAVAGWPVELRLCCGWPVAFVPRTHFPDASGDAIDSIVFYWNKRVCPGYMTVWRFCAFS
jgi:hypothetical protein